MTYNRPMTRKNNLITCLLLAAITMLLAACGSSSAEAEATENASMIATSIYQTMQVMIQTEAPAITPTTAMTATTSILPTQAPPTAMVTTPVNVVPTQAVSPNCLLAGLVNETIKDGTLMQKGATFTKQWTIINAGTCTWSNTYKMVFISGEIMGAPTEVNLKESVNPGTITSVSINMKAPTTDGTYTGNWMLQTNAGANIAPFTVKIVVGAPTATAPLPFSVTNVSTGAVDQNPGICPYDYSFNINVTASGAGTVTYFIEDSVLGVGATNSLDFVTAGTVTTAHSMILFGDGAYWVKVYIDQPNHQYFGPFSFNVICP